MMWQTLTEEITLGTTQTYGRGLPHPPRVQESPLIASALPTNVEKIKNNIYIYIYIYMYVYIYIDKAVLPSRVLKVPPNQLEHIPKRYTKYERKD